MWNKRYGEEEYFYGTQPNDFLKGVAVQIPKGKVLCLGDGEGRNSVYLATLGFDVVSVDLSEVGLKKAERLAEQHKVSIQTIVANLADFEIAENSYSAIVSIFCHVPPAIRDGLHKRASMGLSKDGLMILEAYTPEQIGNGTGGPPVAELMMTLDGLREDFDELEFLHAIEFKREVLEGKGHTGKASVVQLLARR